ncbi:CLUMA_CG010168, isoform A [Clunio marinus]|uniref:CLUMA_CG010168, isoform A n=1 Tax=Clunio marinus TaxID=568069 RepID=A0A1J1IDP0_9DIPT|nr:CLUMA_CG010168, isoform A [Clunio marinus]
MKIENEINRKENIYDIICYYNEGDNDDPQHVKEVINKIVKTSQQENLNTDKWIKWKLLGCLLINVLLNAPIYSYGTIYLLHKEAFDDDPKIVLPPIIFCSVYLLVTPWLFNTISTPSSRSSRAPKTDTSIFTKLTNKSVIIVFSLILCVSMSSCIIMGKLFVLINTVLNNDRLHMINFIYSFGQALAQFAFPFMMKPLMGLVCHNCFFLMIGAVMFHIIPLTMLLMKSKFSLQLNQRKMTKSPIQLNLNDESRYSDTSDTFDFVVNIKYPSDVFDVENKWQNPNNNFKDISGSDPKCDHFLEDLEALRIMNSDGVEILQTIMETDEENENRNSELSEEIIESIYDEINRKHKQQRRQDISKPNQCGFIKKFIFEKARRVSTTIYRQIVNPLHRSMKIFKFYPSVILKSCDIFSYILFITLILPNLALKQYRFVDREKLQINDIPLMDSYLDLFL